MALTNAHNAHNAHAASGGPDGDGALLAQALIIAREGIADAADPVAAPPARHILAPSARLARIEPEFAHAILLYEMLESLGVTPEPGPDPVARVDVLARLPDGPRLLLSVGLPSDADFAAELGLMMGYAELRAERLAKIEVQTRDILTFFVSILPVKPGRARSLHRLLALAMDLSTFVVQRLKIAFAAPRAEMLSDQIQPMIATPLHGSYPSGHATQAFAVAMLLTILTRADRSAPAAIRPESQLLRMAARVAANRTVAGVHFPVDSAAGAMLGITLARWIAARAGAAGQDCPMLDFDGGRWGLGAAGGSRDFHLSRLCAVFAGDPCLDIGAAVAAPVSDLLAAAWAEAQGEWEARWS